MTIAEAKKIHCVDYLKTKGFSPKKEYLQAAWFLSPFRDETEPSFKVHLTKNVFYDFGSGEGGDVITLAKLLESCSTTEAVRRLSNLGFLISPAEFKKEPTLGKPAKIELIKLAEIKSPALRQYLSSRAIELKFATQFVQEGTFEIYGRRFFGLAFRNDKGGFEIRNLHFKGGNSPKHFTTIPAKQSHSINIFEGFMDFLSACTFYRYVPKNPTIVLNSLVFLEKSTQYFKRDQHLNLYLDNDFAGRKATETIKKRFVNVTDQSQTIFPNCKDFNDFLRERATLKNID